ncbi:hypothetical protein Bcav_3683 [Beutenbergia cavernae DSM 12333]|uniref:Uncharacterized protein n=1 Tax=Beutenbergia cavernae (strain ATCC BAA-8 / DSM 12333 / CCUG 43141 / JCM 11478 / NBRC 16432 / NCIMB 13614 / HKI 0122) TaxID=471853 RepID=C5C3L6_BEUC1|nr:hypothetical protein [Beutenbergia cavernae]ACQ81925.1 hypothetical protein Bcav_3683 [Beutenbergia cavernae DSM 12333]
MYLWDQAVAAEVAYRQERLAAEAPGVPGALLQWWRRRREERRAIEAVWAAAERWTARELPVITLPEAVVSGADLHHLAQRPRRAELRRAGSEPSERSAA